MSQRENPNEIINIEVDQVPRFGKTDLKNIEVHSELIKDKNLI